jgi:DNA-binding response OmpR family regulator
MRVLLAEDDKQLAGRLREDLLRRGFAVDLAGDGVDAEHLGSEEDYDCVILDLGLPGRPGLEVLKNWRRRRKLMPVLILTGRDAWHEKVEGFRAGADDYLAKPFHFEELLARLQALIRRSHGLALPTLGGDGLSLDEDRQTVIRDGVRARCFPRPNSATTSMPTTRTMTAMSSRSISITSATRSASTASEPVAGRVMYMARRTDDVDP